MILLHFRIEKASWAIPIIPKDHFISQLNKDRVTKAGKLIPQAYFASEHYFFALNPKFPWKGSLGPSSQHSSKKPKF